MTEITGASVFETSTPALHATGIASSSTYTGSVRFELDPTPRSQADLHMISWGAGHSAIAGALHEAPPLAVLPEAAQTPSDQMLRIAAAVGHIAAY